MNNIMIGQNILNMYEVNVVITANLEVSEKLRDI